MEDQIAVIGMACRVPGAADLKAFWRNLIDGVVSRTEVSRAQVTDPDFVPAAYLLDDVENFDAAFFGMTPREAALTDPQHRLFLELCHGALEDAGWDPARFEGDIGVYGGRGMETYRWKHLYANREVMAYADHTTIGNGNHPDTFTTLVSYHLNLRGPSVGVYTACSTSLVAVHMAAEALRARECDMALAGGSNIEFDHGYVHREGAADSPDGYCRPFDAAPSGVVAGSGGGVVLLKRLSDAIADGDNVRAIIIGNAVNNDGAAKVGFTASGVAGQASVIANALGVAGIEPQTIGYVEASATGSALGDAIEVEALTAVYGKGGGHWCAIGSVKSNLGHLSQSAGVVGLIKTVLALEHGLVPPSIGFTKPNPAIDFESSPFYVNTTLSALNTRRAAVSSFGIGGTNAHVILEQAAPAEARVSEGPHILTLSARSDAALEAAATRLADHLAGDINLADVAHTLRIGRVDYPHRIAVVASDKEQAAAALRKARRHVVGQLPRVVFVVQDESGDEQAKQWQSWGVTPDAIIERGPDMAREKGALFVECGKGPVHETMAKLWVRGVPISIATSGRRVPLPGYPYERIRHWVEPDSAAAKPVEHRADGLASIWTALLGVKEIGPQDDFFALGGTSLTAVQLIAQVRKVFEVRLTMRSIFDAPTLAGLEAVINQRRSERRAVGS